MGYSFRLAARVLLYAPSHIQDNTYYSLSLHQSWSTGWNKKQLNGSTMKDRSNDPKLASQTIKPSSTHQSSHNNLSTKLYLYILCALTNKLSYGSLGMSFEFFKFWSNISLQIPVWFSWSKFQQIL